MPLTVFSTGGMPDRVVESVQTIFDLKSESLIKDLIIPTFPMSPVIMWWFCNDV